MEEGRPTLKSPPFIRGYTLRDVFTDDELNLMKEHMRCWDETAGKPRPRGKGLDAKPWTMAERRYVAELYERARNHGFFPFSAKGSCGWLQAVNHEGQDLEYLPGWKRVKRGTRRRSRA